MLKNVLKSVRAALEEAGADEKIAIDMFGKMKTRLEKTIAGCTKRIKANTAKLATCKKNIKSTRSFRKARKADQVVAEGDLDEETKRWTKETNIHNTIISEMNDQLKAI